MSLARGKARPSQSGGGEFVLPVRSGFVTSPIDGRSHRVCFPGRDADVSGFRVSHVGRVSQDHSQCAETVAKYFPMEEA
jgi:hypothetical protein